MSNNKKEKSKIKFALLGASKISTQHLIAFGNLSDRCELVDICDNNPLALESISKLSEADLHEDYRSMLNETTADCVVVTTPNGLHAEHSIMAAESGMHVVTEKPIAIDCLEAEKMLDIFSSQNKKLFVVKQMRFLKSLRILKQAISENRFGKIFYIGANVFWTRPQDYYDSAKWRGTWKMDGGGALMNQAIHYIDLLQWLGGKVNTVQAINKTLQRNIEAEDTSLNLFNFESGAVGSCMVTLLTFPKNLETSITVLGEKGTVKVGGQNLNSFTTWQFEDKASYDPSISVVFDQESAHTSYYRNVLESLLFNAVPEVDGEEALKSLEIVLASYKSSSEKKIIRI